jgi:hypothetical protein
MGLCRCRALWRDEPGMHCKRRLWRLFGMARIEEIPMLRQFGQRIRSNQLLEPSARPGYCAPSTDDHSLPNGAQSGSCTLIFLRVPRTSDQFAHAAEPALRRVSKEIPGNHGSVKYEERAACSRPILGLGSSHDQSQGVFRSLDVQPYPYTHPQFRSALCLPRREAASRLASCNCVTPNCLHLHINPCDVIIGFSNVACR